MHGRPPDTTTSVRLQPGISLTLTTMARVTGQLLRLLTLHWGSNLGSKLIGKVDSLSPSQVAWLLALWTVSETAILLSILFLVVCCLRG